VARAWIEELLRQVVLHVVVVFAVVVSGPSSNCWVVYGKDLGHPALDVQRRLNSCYCSWGVLIVHKMKKRSWAGKPQGGSLVDHG